MAGTNFENCATTTAAQSMALTTVHHQWEVEYARYIHYPPLDSLLPTHPTLVPQTHAFRKRFRTGEWLPTSDYGVFVKLVPPFSTSSDDAILMVYYHHKILEQHYVSRLHFSWPQVTCISGFAARGTRTIFLSYKDCGNSDQIQKFAIRFSTAHETEKFISALKDTMEDSIPDVNPANFESGVSSQQEFDPSNCPSFISVDESWRSGLSLDCSSHCVPTTTDHVVAQASNGQELILINQAEEIISNFPPSFTSFLMNCCPTAEQAKPTKTDEANLKDQILKYMKDPSFQDILTKAEKLVTELGDDMQFPNL